MKKIKFLALLMALCGGVAFAAEEGNLGATDDNVGSSRTDPVTVAVGQSKTVTASGNIAANGNSTTGWSEGTPKSATDVATVVPSESNGSTPLKNTTRKPSANITGVGAGYTTYQMKNDKDANIWTIDISVTDAKSENVTLSIGGTKPLTCTYTGKSGTGAEQWSATSSKADVATVTSVSGTAATVTPTITAKANGEAVITVKNAYITYTYNVRVSNPTEERSVSLSQGKSETIESPRTTEAKITLEPGAEDIVGISTNNGHFVFTGKNDGKSKVTLSTAAKDYVYAVKTATLDATKTVTVDPSDQTMATIEIVSHILPGMTTAPTNNILFISSTCTSHGLGGSGKDTNTAKQRTMDQINTLAKKGNVDWYLFGVSQNESTTSSTNGTVKYEKSISSIGGDWGSSRHRNLKQYLATLNTKLDTAHKNYDYIVLSFDGGRLAIDFSSYNQTQAVAQKLRWYYEHDRVIWITESAQDDDSYEQYKSVYYRPASTHDDGFMNQATWEAMVALLDPVTYLDKTSGNRWTEKKTNVRVGTTTSDVWAATRNDAQATYDDPDAVEKLLNERIKKPMAFDQTVADAVNTNGLQIVTGSKMYLSYDNSKWTEVAGGVKVVGNVVTGSVEKIGKEAWTKLVIPVQDKNGKFLVPDKSKDWILSNDVADASIWYADPNAKLSDKGARGPAVLMVEENDENTGNKPEEWVTGEVETSAPWKFKCKQWSVTATDAPMTYNGRGTNITFVVTDEKGTIINSSEYEVAYSNASSKA